MSRFIHVQSGLHQSLNGTKACGKQSVSAGVEGYAEGREGCEGPVSGLA